MSDSDRDLLVRVHRDVEAGLASARKLWGDDAGEETLRLTAEAYLVHLRELRRSGGFVPAITAASPANVGNTGPTGNPFRPTEKQITFYQRLAQSSVFTPDERQRAAEWLATKATRQTIKDQIDWLKQQVETRKAHSPNGRGA
jgi:hypothetical protein